MTDDRYRTWDLPIIRCYLLQNTNFVLQIIMLSLKIGGSESLSSSRLSPRSDYGYPQAGAAQVSIHEILVKLTP